MAWQTIRADQVKAGQWIVSLGIVVEAIKARVSKARAARADGKTIVLKTFAWEERLRPADAVLVRVKKGKK